MHRDYFVQYRVWSTSPLVILTTAYFKKCSRILHSEYKSQVLSEYSMPIQFVSSICAGQLLSSKGQIAVTRESRAQARASAAALPFRIYFMDELGARARRCA